MRTIAVLAALAIAATLAGCAGEVRVLDGVSVRCSDKEVKVINPAGRLEVRPESVKVCRGNSVVFTFSPKEPSKRANTKDSSGSTTGAWLTANGTTADGITIAVRPEVMPMEYKYTLEIEGLGLLDPRIVVQ